MKNTEQIAETVLRIRDAEQKKLIIRNQRIKRVTAGASSILVFCAAILAVRNLNSFQGNIPTIDNHTVIHTETPATSSDTDNSTNENTGTDHSTNSTENAVKESTSAESPETSAHTTEKEESESTGNSSMEQASITTSPIIQTQPPTNIQTTAVVQTTVVPPESTITDTQPINEDMLNIQTPPESNSYLFDSYNDLSDAIIKSDSSIKADSNNYGEVFNKTVSAFKIKAIDLYVPAVDGNACTLRNKEGFSNISLMTAELYNLPWIWYHCKVNDTDVDVKIAYHSIIDNTELNSAKTYYEVLKLIAPEAPNPDNFTKYESYLNIYESEINLANGKKAFAMTSETTNNKVYVMFIYEGKLVSVYADKDTLSESFWNSFSLEKY